MLRAMATVLICMTTFQGLCQSPSKYQVGTITDVKTHPSSKGAQSDAATYDVSIKVGGTIYVALYTPPFGMLTGRSASGRELLVLVGKTTITYNDILGNSWEVPILNRKFAGNAKQSK